MFAVKLKNSIVNQVALIQFIYIFSFYRSDADVTKSVAGMPLLFLFQFCFPKGISIL